MDNANEEIVIKTEPEETYTIDSDDDDEITELEHLRKLFIGGLAAYTNEASLKTFFGKWGKVVDCVVMRDNATKRSRGFGFITYSKTKMVDVAQEHRPHIIDGKTVDTKRAQAREREGKEANLSVKKIFIGGLKDYHDEDDLHEYFSQFGKVVGVNILIDRSNGKRRGFAFVEFEDYDTVDKVILQKTHQIKNDIVDVKKSVYKQDNNKNEWQSSRPQGAVTTKKPTAPNFNRPPMNGPPMNGPPMNGPPMNGPPANYNWYPPYNYNGYGPMNNWNWNQPPQNGWCGPPQPQWNQGYYGPSPPGPWNPGPYPPQANWNAGPPGGNWNAGPPMHGQGPMPQPGPMSQQGPMPHQGPMPQQGPMPHQGPMPQQGPLSHRGPMPQNGPMPQQGPMNQQGPMPQQGPMSPHGPVNQQGPISPRGPMNHQRSMSPLGPMQKRPMMPTSPHHHGRPQQQVSPRPHNSYQHQPNTSPQQRGHSPKPQRDLSQYRSLKRQGSPISQQTSSKYGRTDSLSSGYHSRDGRDNTSSFSNSRLSSFTSSLGGSRQQSFSSGSLNRSFMR